MKHMSRFHAYAEMTGNRYEDMYMRVRTIDSDGMPTLSGKNFRTKEEYPYSYDPYLLYHTGEKSVSGLYTDRLLQWDYDKHNRLCREVFGNEGQYWHDRSPKDINKFLNKWLGEKVELVSIVQYCNASNGYPTWFLSWKDPK
jgi:hypothetical protein